ncbi:helix-turn-helix domain-containing protein [Sciscionella marina]|uniref:helix-turn-helix domain-containing protein n=1 Tax=Sciscionella marina TaxID=508770 RepID=UPI00036D9D57|nr:helix-turn-helix domain-containing protein [Sciscionella marina]
MPVEVEFAQRAAIERLRPYVRGYTGYRQDGVPEGLHRGLPSRSITLIISLSDPVRMIGGPGTEHGPLALSAAIGGLHLRPALIAQDRTQYGIHVELDPLGVRALLGVSATELASGVFDLAELPVPWRRDLVDRLVEAPDWSRRFAILDECFVAGLRPVTLVSEVRWAWQRMAAETGGARVHELAGELGWSRRHFGARFSAEVGVTPKQAARLTRFERSKALLRAGGHGSLAEVAIECGYYDQAHLAAEWREFAGCPPSTWIAEELPFLQATGE